ncbi:ferrochelatase [Paenibacillus chitinolyticus]|uniref:Coproporphyrin III ferrochelatase n=1 Tax=Paenibacillus chitinolyticus TaxID=79263 RepID=A0A410X243_9BACL|nr:ferrochelatase [Paenibacillus chitinolyticus]MCY9593518.1 ferrochelatase [Paenibacillus chitinolyticus]MCY9597489.1 ferrochelatase [Paenibacillus chitinolyticus]QAV20688.1 ferrochelatase [Paenibacillus chitinolyticus]
MSGKKVGVLVMSYGTPQSMEDIEAYYTHIRRGNKPSPEQLHELTSRYEAIVGGVFPLRENTDNQVAGLQNALASEHDDVEFVCFQGLKHAYPFIEDGIEQMAQCGITEGVGIVLAPHYSTMSIGSYNKRAREKAAEYGISMTFVDSYHLHPKLIQALTERVERALGKFGEENRSSVRVLFSAHSLPEKILELGDPYPEQLLETSRAIADKAGIENWQFAWQSAGQTATPWLGPDILDVLRTLAKEDVKRVLVCPIGFVSDHLEVLYDLDIEAQQLAKEIGLHLERTDSLNTDQLYMQTLSDAVWKQYGELTKQA